MHPFTIALGLFCVAGSIAISPAPIENPPASPLVAPVPEKAAWTLAPLQAEVKEPPPATKKKKKKDAPAPVAAAPMPAPTKSNIAKVHTTIGLPTKHDEITLNNGDRTDNWYTNGILLISQTGAEVSTSRITGVWDTTGPSVPSGFPGMGWIKPELFDAVVTFRKQPCYHYVLPGSPGDPATAEAWIHVDTRLPAAYRHGADTYVYEFEPPPDRPLTMPEPIQAAFDANKEAQERQRKLERELGGR